MQRLCFLLLLALLLLPLSSAAWGQNQKMTHEEEVVRTTYARLAFANQVGEAHAMLKENREKKAAKGIDRGDFQRRMQFGALQFQLGHFKAGPLSDIAKTKYSDLVTKPASAEGDSLSVAPGTFKYGKDGNETNSAIASAEWVPTHDINEDWDQPFAPMFAKTELAGKYDRYVTFSVHVAFQGRSRDYRAMFLFGADGDTEIVFAGDMIVNINGNALTTFVSQDVYPETLIEGGLGRDPVLRDWLNSGQVSGTGHKAGKSNCDPATGKCGIHRDDLKKLDKPTSLLRRPDAARSPMLMDASFHPRTPQPRAMLQEGPATTCTDFNNVKSLDPENFADSGDHITGGHQFVFFRRTACLYSDALNSNGKCNSECDVLVNPIGQETGLTLSACHQQGKNILNGFETATGGSSKCNGGAGAAVRSCLLCLCNVSIKIEKGPIGITVSSDGFYTVKSEGSNSCVAQTQPFVPTANPAPPPCAPPPGGDTQFTADTGNDQDCEPIIIDIEGRGFQLTNTANGVVFDIRADQRPLQIPWTANGNNAFLVLDRNGNGVIDDGTELFSNVSPQPKSAHPNGFRALAEYDKPENGGDGDGEIDSQDAIFPHLRLWVDANHDGISQPEELHKLHELGVYSISLNVGPSRRTDEFGNEFLYKARVNQGRHHGDSEVGHIAYDVFFVTK